MSYVSVMVPMQDLQIAAMRLLASSTASQFVEAAVSSAADVRNSQSLGPDSAWLGRALGAIQELWTRVLSVSTREPEEAELAVLLALVAESSDARVDRVLQLVSRYDQPPVRWLGALARQLLAQRPANSTDAFSLRSHFAVEGNTSNDGDNETIEQMTGFVAGFGIPKSASTADTQLLAA